MLVEAGVVDVEEGGLSVALQVLCNQGCGVGDRGFHSERDVVIL